MLVDKSAESRAISDCIRHPSSLTFELGPKDRTAAWVLLRLPVPHDVAEDRASTRVVERSRSWGYDQLVIVNLFALWPGCPERRSLADDAVGPDNRQSRPVGLGFPRLDANPNSHFPVHHSAAMALATNTVKSRRRGHGEGSIYRREADGRWVGSVNLGWVNGRRQRKVVYGKTQAEVVRKVRLLKADIARGLPAPDDRTTVEELLRRWLSDVMPGRVRPATLHNYRLVAEQHIIPVLGKKKLSALSPTDVQALIRMKQESRLPRRVRTRNGTVARRVAGGYSPRTIKLIRGVLGQALRQAERWGMVGRNVVALTDGPRVVQAEGRTLTPEQARSLLRAASGERLEAAFVLMLSLGLRKGEVFGLRWADVDLDNEVITVAQGLSRVDSRLVLGPVKTERSRRKINLPREVVSALRAHRTRQATERLALGESWRDTSLVFTNEIGAPIDPTNFRHTFDRVTAKAGLIGWHPHELRHSCASLLLAQGVPLEVVSRVLGHSSIRITADVYGHILEPQRQQAADAMSAALWTK